MMNNLRNSLLGFCLVVFSATGFSAQNVIAGPPTELEFHQGYYTFPPSYVATPGYRFITLNNVERVCYLTIKPELKSLDMLHLVIKEHETQMQWNCYQYDPRFFENSF